MTEYENVMDAATDALSPRGGKPAPRVPTRLRLILAAEQLFGELGIDAAPLRMVCDAAGQRNKNAVQYHFGDRMGLLQAIFTYREEQLGPQRTHLLDLGQAANRLMDVRFLLRILFEPNFRMYRDQGEIGYLKLHAAFLTSHWPRGVTHPVEHDLPCTRSYRRALDLLRSRLAYLGPGRFDLRLPCVGSMFLNGVVQHAVRAPERNLPIDVFYEDMLDMMTEAITALPWPVRPGGHAPA